MKKDGIKDVLGFIKDVAILLCVVAIAFLASTIANKLSDNFLIGYLTAVGTLILIPIVIILGKKLATLRSKKEV
ncbi:MAG: hypothetical protein Q7S52_02870 [bacterium]|nr:hypothetical protein [bacterium]